MTMIDNDTYDTTIQKIVQPQKLIFSQQSRWNNKTTVQLWIRCLIIFKMKIEKEKKRE